MLNLEPRYIQIIQKILAKHLPQVIVWAYGSRVKNTAHSGSDLDLVVMTPVSQKQLSAVRNALSESNLPILVDLLEWDAIPDAFRAEIQKTHELIQSQSKRTMQ